MSLELSFAERRVLGVLIEKSFTTPEQYPLTLNGVVVGSNQKSCRSPVTTLDEQTAFESLDSLRKKGLVVLVRSEGSRADRWKHRTGECLELEPKGVAILAELLLRGPQTDGELRQRASRMVPLGEFDDVVHLVEGLARGDDALVLRLSPPDRRRGAKFAHNLYPPDERPEPAAGSGSPPLRAEARRHTPEAPASHADGTPPEREGGAGHEPRAVDDDVALAQPQPSQGASATRFEPASDTAPSGSRIEELLRRVKALEERVEELEATFVKFLR